MRIRTVELSEAALEGIGRPLTGAAPIGAAIGAGGEFSYGVLAGDLGLGASPSAGCLDCAVRERRVAKLERHLKTPELLVAMEGDSVLCVAPPQEPSGGTLAGLAAVRVRKGQSLILETGAWHWIPFPEGNAPSRFLVVFRSKTGEDDLGFCELAEPVELATGGE